MSSVAGLQRIAPVPTSVDFIDMVLNSTMRKTPTVIHKNVCLLVGLVEADRNSLKYLVSGTVSFYTDMDYVGESSSYLVVYMRKVKFTQDVFDEKIGRILTEFPILDVGLLRALDHWD